MTKSYGHYFITWQFTDIQWETFTQFVERLSHYKPTICGPDGFGHAIINDIEVKFNGDRNLNQSGGVFRMTKNPIPYVKGKSIRQRSRSNPGYAYCNTKRLPYDDAVVACLLYINNMDDHLIRIVSDGFGADWHRGYDLCKAICPNWSFKIPDSI